MVDALIIGGAALVVAGTVTLSVIRKKKGQTGCGCGCSGCPSAGACAAAKKQQEEQQLAQENVREALKQDEQERLPTNTQEEDDAQG